MASEQHKILFREGRKEERKKIYCINSLCSTLLHSISSKLDIKILSCLDSNPRRNMNIIVKTLRGIKKRSHSMPRQAKLARKCESDECNRTANRNRIETWSVCSYFLLRFSFINEIFPRKRSKRLSNVKASFGRFSIRLKRHSIQIYEVYYAASDWWMPHGAGGISFNISV